MTSITDLAQPFRRRFRLPSLFRRKPSDPRLPKPGTREWEQEMRRQTALIAQSPGEAEDIALMESLHQD